MRSVVNDYIDTDLKFRTYKKLKAPIQRQFPGMTDNEVKDIVNERNHDIYIHRSKKDRRDYQRVYQVKIFSRHRGSWFGDLYDNLDGNNPRYWHVFINTNTRYAVAYPLQTKESKDIHGSLQQFINECHPKKLTHDEEKGLVTQANEDLLKNNNCALFIVTEKNHSTLGIIDRFIRTLRDMNRPGEDDGKQSTDKEFTYISPYKMNELLWSYNNTIHSSTGMTPKEMNDDPQKEVQYIQKCLNKELNQYAVKDFKLQIGDKVRYLLPRNTMGKKRYMVSREVYTIDSMLGNNYTIIAKDGSTMNLPRWRLIKVNEDKPMADSTGTGTGAINKVLGRNRTRNKFVVEMSRPNGTTYQTQVTVRDMRLPHPQVPTHYESQYP